MKRKLKEGVKVFLGLFAAIVFIVALGLSNFYQEKAEQREQMRLIQKCVDSCSEMIYGTYAYPQETSMFDNIFLRMTGEWNYFCTCINQKGVKERIEVNFR